MREESSTHASEEDAVGKKSRWRLLLLLFPLLLISIPLLFWLSTYLFLNTPLGPALLSGPTSRVTLDWKGGHSWIPGQIHVEGFTLKGVTPKGRWQLDIDRADLRHRLRPFFTRAFVADTIHARGAAFSWTSFDEPKELPPRKKRSGLGWRLSFPQIEIDGLRRLAFDDNEVDAAAHPGQARLALELVIRGLTEVPSLQLELSDAVIDSENEALARLEHLKLRGQLDAFNPRENRGAAALRFATGEIELQSEAWNLANLSNFFRGLPVRIDGRGKLDAHLHVEKGVLDPKSRLAVRDGQLKIDYLAYHAEGTGGLRLEGDEVNRRSRLVATLDTYTFGHLGEPPHVEGENLSLIGSGPPLDLANPEPQFVAEIRVPEARVPDFSVFASSLPPGVPVRLQSGSGTMDLALKVDPDPVSISGTLGLEGREIVAEIQQEKVWGDLQLKVELEEGEIESRRFRLGHLSLDLDDVAAVGLSDWWARLQIAEGEITLNRPLQLSGTTTAVLSDARPLAALLIDHQRTVSWLSRVLNEKSVRASAEVRLHEEALSLETVEVASGSRLRAHGDLLLARDEITGLLLVEFGRLAAAAELRTGGDKKFKMRRARDWFESRRAAKASQVSDD